MKNPIRNIVLGILMVFALQVNAQVFDIPTDVYAELTKEEKKEWKKTAKQYKRNPKDLKVLTREHEYYSALSTDLQEQLAHKNQRFEALENEAKFLSHRLFDVEKSYADISGVGETGIVFKLQIGAFEKVKLPSDLPEAKKVATEEGDKVQKILLGKFRDYEKAKKFQGYLKEMGIDDAWIVSYKDGKRIPIEEALYIKP